jgi:hypothetical protein
MCGIFMYTFFFFLQLFSLCTLRIGPALLKKKENNPTVAAFSLIQIQNDTPGDKGPKTLPHMNLK